LLANGTWPTQSDKDGAFVVLRREDLHTMINMDLRAPTYRAASDYTANVELHCANPFYLSG
jgi:hypothetical protein